MAILVQDIHAECSNIHLFIAIRVLYSPDDTTVYGGRIFIVLLELKLQYSCSAVMRLCYVEQNHTSLLDKQGDLSDKSQEVDH